MTTFKEAAEEFLARQRIAVAGVSRGGQSPGNQIYRKLRDSGHHVFAVNPNAEMVEGDICFPDLRSISRGVDGVVIATRPRVTATIVQECITLRIPRIWMHRSFGEGSVNSDAARLARQQGLQVLEGGCPTMFCEPVDVAQRCMRWILGATGGLPDPVPLDRE